MGCYLAIYLGFGPPDWKTALNQVIDIPRFQAYWDILQARVSVLPILRKKHSASKGNPHSTTNQITGNLNPQQIGNTDSSSNNSVAAANNDIANDDFISTIITDQTAKTWFIQEEHIEVALMKLNIAIKKSGQFASELDWRIRSFRSEITLEDVKQFLNELRDDCRNYLESQASITEQMKNRLDEFGVLKNLAEEIDYANMEQSAQIETTLSNLDHFELTDNPNEGTTRLIKELANLRLVRHRLRDMQDRAFVHIIFNEKREETIPQQLFIDESFGMYNRIGLEVTIREWWQQKRHEKELITFALLDFVKFGEANEEHGIMICNKIIKFFGSMLKERFEEPDLVGIYFGNCFLVAAINTSPKKTIAEIERIRQWCEKTTFRYNDGKEKMRLQLTCAITESLAMQSENDVMTALEKTLTAAKKAGRNHTFYYVPGPLDNPPEKIAAPDFGEEGTEINLT
ncbi:MAG: GGDEF domain-containing protein [Planctomycetaceae bacterium]|nr:GGDEF domain-containing protein [Planctomycetaceae bacterium]